jgi:hypothetical protein
MRHDLTALTRKYFERCNYEVNSVMNTADEGSHAFVMRGSVTPS